MLTPAKMHFDKVMAERRGRVEDGFQERTAYEQILYRLRMDKTDLSQVQSNATKADLKRKMLPNYQSWIEGTLSADTGQADDVLTTIMIWCVDCGDIAQALRIGEYVLRHKLPMPDQYKRTAATVLAEEICDPILAGFKADPFKSTVSVDLLMGLHGLTANEDMPDAVRSKLCKAIGFTFRLDRTLEAMETAIGYLREATRLNPQKAGVKRDIENLLRDIKEITRATSGEDDAENSQVTSTADTDTAKSKPEQTPEKVPAKKATASKSVKKDKKTTNKKAQDSKAKA
ncbi:phage terminase small subunit [Limnobaculum xujianqingii]|uniref:phage terminase small subunit n=1 Tax=Limnobaculum xujianqingii TaxID=2738837 RepID=UPI00112688A6|nr:phage terminase small subunit [Limnobaculum xujianqingii]